MAQFGMNSKKKSVLTSLLAGESVPAAAESAGVGVRTVYNWLRDDEEFKTALDAVQSVMIDYLLIDLMRVQNKAISVIENILDDSEVSAGIQLRAAGLALDNTMRLYEMRNLDRRLAQLEIQTKSEGESDS